MLRAIPKEETESRAVAFLAWLDAFERIDTLMLEIRHVQETIVSQLRRQELYIPFRYEDHYLWGSFQSVTQGVIDGDSDERPPSPQKDWFEVLDSLPVVSTGCEVLSILWCPEFIAKSPEPTAFQGLTDTKGLDLYGDCYDKCVRPRCERELVEVRNDLSGANTLHANDEYLYEALRYLQLIKRDVLCDKLVLASRAIKMFRTGEKPAADEEPANYDPLAAFLIVRRGALKQLNLRLEHFSDVVSNVQEILNLSLEKGRLPPCGDAAIKASTQSTLQIAAGRSLARSKAS